MKKTETSLPKTGGTPLRAASAALMIVVWFAMAALLANVFIVWPTPALFFDVWFDVLCLLFLVPLVLIPIQVVRYFRRSGNSARHSKLALSLRITFFGVFSGLLWSSAPIFFSNRTPHVFVICAVAGIITGPLVAFALSRPLSRSSRWGTFLLGLLALPLGAFCFGISFGLIELVAGYPDASIPSVSYALLAPLYFGVFYMYMAIVSSCFSYFGFISFPSALLTTYLLRLVLLYKLNPREPV